MPWGGGGARAVSEVFLQCTVFTVCGVCGVWCLQCVVSAGTIYRCVVSSTSWSAGFGQ